MPEPHNARSAGRWYRAHALHPRPHHRGDGSGSDVGSAARPLSEKTPLRWGLSLHVHRHSCWYPDIAFIPASSGPRTRTTSCAAHIAFCITGRTRGNQVGTGLICVGVLGYLLPSSILARALTSPSAWASLSGRSATLLISVPGSYRLPATISAVLPARLAAVAVPWGAPGATRMVRS